MRQKIETPASIKVRLKRSHVILFYFNESSPILINNNFAMCFQKNHSLLFLQSRVGCVDFRCRFLKKLLTTFNSIINNVRVAIFCFLRAPKGIIFSVGLGFKLVYSETEKALFLKLGFSHTIKAGVPLEIRMLNPVDKTCLIKSVSLTKLRYFASSIQKQRFPDIYKSRGILLNWQRLQKKRIKKNN